MTFTVVLAIVLTAAVVFASILLYPNARFVFSGMTMQNGVNGKVHGFVNLILKDVNAMSVGFTIKYDENYIVPSNYETNEATDDFNSFYMQNTVNFPEGALNTVTSEISGEDGIVSMIVKPDTRLPLEDAGDNIGFTPDYEGTEDRYKCILANEVSGGLDLGKLSFQIVDPAGVSQMTPAELKQIFYVVDDSVEILYYDEENTFQTAIIEYDWNIEITLIDVNPVSSTINVLAPDIYTDGTEQDLIDYLNLNHKRVQLKWSNYDITLDNMVWDLSKCDITGTPYDPRGGTYTITQPYNDEFDVSVTINVESVNLIGFLIDNRSITYTAGTQPADMTGLNLPEDATPVLDKVVNRFALADLPLDFDSWTPDTLPAGFVNGDTGTYVFDNTVDISSLATTAPWLTTDKADTAVSADRTIGDITPAPREDEIEAEVDKKTGVLTITVSSLQDTKIEPGTTFRVKFPNGYILDSSNSIMTETVNEDGSATIVITTTDMTDLTESAIQSMINLGSSRFALSAKAPDKGESSFTGFTSPKRENFYTQHEEIDYSGGKRSLFAVTAGMDLDAITKHVNLLDSSVIHIAYDGMTGRQPAEMKEVHVDSWSIEGDESATALPDTPGETVTLVGKMTHGYFYTNHGIITNTDEFLLKLKVTTSEKVTTPENERIKVTTNETEYYEQLVNPSNPFYFDTKQVGYGSAQIQTFTIHNLGTEDIDGLNIHIDSTDFILVSPPEPSIEKETGKTTFRLSNKTGLSAGTYRATVTVGSNGNTSLETFEVIFKVTNGPVYKVTVVENDATLGDARVIGSAYYEAGEEVEIIATAAPGCEFKQWECTDLADINGITDPNPTFEMPAQDLTIIGIFEETIEGKLRLSDLRVKNPDESDNVLRDAVNTVIPFSPDVDEYFVIVPYETEQNKIWVKPRYPEINGTTIEPAIDNAGTSIPATLDEDGYYKTDLFDLVVGDNVYTITQSYEGVGRTYTVTIIRKGQVNVTLANGNSPYGLIEADTTGLDKAAAKDYFAAHYRYNVAPEGAVTTAAEVYYPDAWTYKNFDMDAKALFVYSGKAFVDPGFSELKNSLGEDVDPLTVTRTIKVMQPNDPTEANVVTKLTDAAQIVDTVISGGESCVIDTIKDKAVRPGIYKIEYSFIDSDGSENSFSRPLIVLYGKGDADATMLVDATDYANIYERMTNGISAELIGGSEDWCRVYTYRILDVNSDRNVNSIDANKIAKTDDLTEYYEVLPESLE